MKTVFSVVAVSTLFAGCAPLDERVIQGVSNLPVVSAGYGSTCILGPSRTVECFGFTPGNGTTYTPHTSAVTPLGLGKAIKIEVSNASSSYASCAITEDTSVSCWSNANGATPLKVSGVTGATDIAVAGNEACAVTVDGVVQCWNPLAPSSPATIRQDVNSAKSITAGYDHFCVINTAQAVVCWGGNFNGQLGNTIKNGTTDVVAANSVSGIQAKSVSGGYGFTCAVDLGGRVLCWGVNDYGQLGTGLKDNGLTPHPSPQYVNGIDGATMVSAGWQFTCARRWNHEVLCWGLNDKGQLGNGTKTDSFTPVSVANLTGMVIISAGVNHACASGLGMRVRCWGANGTGQLANGTTNEALVPAP